VGICDSLKSLIKAILGLPEPPNKYTVRIVFFEAGAVELLQTVTFLKQAVVLYYMRIKGDIAEFDGSRSIRTLHNYRHLGRFHTTKHVQASDCRSQEPQMGSVLDWVNFETGFDLALHAHRRRHV
jgi:hypothetical protein